MNKNFFFENIKEFSFDEKVFTKIEALIFNENKKEGELSFVFCSDEYLLKMNIDYLNHDFYTDVITFDYTEGDIISGDVFISIDRITENSQKYNVSFENELQRVMIHGVLHLVGYKDKTQEEQKQMREKETKYLNILKN
ncbi:MAG: rRNA maturation RNase YbeY [Bacteroidetes bacterium]|nr:MAG: rRNA maturation RNase YbeY [Bacteroidota bacterium]